MSQLKILSPLSGQTWPLERVPDPVFAQKLAGDGISIDPTDSCLRAPQPDDDARAIAAGAALLGGAIGLVGGILLTRSVDDEEQSSESKNAHTTLPIATFTPMRDGKGGTVPGVTAMGSF